MATKEYELNHSDFVEWADATFRDATPETITAHLKREAQELADAPRDWSEIADVYLLLVHLESKMPFSLSAAAYRKFEELQERKWGEPDAEGVVEHVRVATPPVVTQPTSPAS
jgi:NTP pyrophosphatase (non-canonical NTP hydrolase)